MKTIIFFLMLSFIWSCEITESLPFLHVGLENQSDHSGIVVELTDPLSYKSTVTDSIGEFNFSGLRDGDGTIICSFPFFQPDTQSIRFENGKVIDWEPIILKQLIAIEISYDDSNALVIEYNSEVYLNVQVKYTNFSSEVFQTMSPYSPGICELIHCYQNNFEPFNEFTLGGFWDGELTAFSSGAILPGTTEFTHMFFIGWSEIVPGEYYLYLAPSNSGNDHFFGQLNNYVFGKENLIRPLKLIIE